jgi:hypothetical protein
MNAFGHINATDFYAALAHLTDAKREVPLPVSAPAISYRLTCSTAA